MGTLFLTFFGENSEEKEKNQKNTQQSPTSAKQSATKTQRLDNLKSLCPFLAVMLFLEVPMQYYHRKHFCSILLQFQKSRMINGHYLAKRSINTWQKRKQAQYQKLVHCTPPVRNAIEKYQLRIFMSSWKWSHNFTILYMEMFIIVQCISDKNKLSLDISSSIWLFVV